MQHKVKRETALKSFLADRSIQNRSHRMIYQLLYQFGPLTLSQLCEKTKLKRLKVKRILDDLTKQSFVETAGFGLSSGGRPPQLYKINPRSSYIVSVYINRLYTRITLFDLTLKVLANTQFEMTPQHTPSAVLSEVKKRINDFMDQYGFELEQLLGIGLAVVGPFDREKGVILNPIGFFAPDWSDVPVIKILQASFPVKILMENYPGLVALAEYHYLKSPHHNILCCLNGLVWACGLLTHGKLWQHEDGDANLYGHMIIDVDGKRTCSCGNRGCAVACSSLGAILEEIKMKRPSDYPTLWNQNGAFSMDKFVALLARAKDLDILVMESAYYFGIGVANLIKMFRPTQVILIGPLVEAVPGYFERAVETAKKFLPPYTKPVEFSKERLKGKAAVIGAALMVINSYFGDIEGNLTSSF